MGRAGISDIVLPRRRGTARPSIACYPPLPGGWDTWSREQLELLDMALRDAISFAEPWIADWCADTASRTGEPGCRRHWAGADALTTARSDRSTTSRRKLAYTTTPTPGDLPDSATVQLSEGGGHASGGSHSPPRARRNRCGAHRQSAQARVSSRDRFSAIGPLPRIHLPANIFAPTSIITMSRTSV